MGTVDIQQSDGIQDMRKDDRGVHSEERIIDAVIPSFYPDEKLLKLVNLLEKQTEELRAIRIINTEKAGLENPVVHDTDAAVRTAVEAIRELIREDGGEKP